MLKIFMAWKLLRYFNNISELQTCASQTTYFAQNTYESSKISQINLKLNVPLMCIPHQLFVTLRFTKILLVRTFKKLMSQSSVPPIHKDHREKYF